MVACSFELSSLATLKEVVGLTQPRKVIDMKQYSGGSEEKELGDRRGVVVPEKQPGVNRSRTWSSKRAISRRRITAMRSC